MGEKNESPDFVIFVFLPPLTRWQKQPSDVSRWIMQDSCHVPHTAVLSVWSVERLNHSWHRALVFSIIFPTASWAGNWFTSVGKMKWTKSGVSLLGENFTSWKSFISCICLKGSAGSSGSCSTNGTLVLSLLLLGRGLVSCPGWCWCRPPACNAATHGSCCGPCLCPRQLALILRLDFCTSIRCCCVFVVEPISHASDLNPASREPCSGKPAERCYLPAGGLRRSSVQRRSTQTGPFVARGTGDWKTHDF